MAFNINQRLNGLEPLAYAGANAVQPPDFVTKPRPPTSTDSKNFYLGQIWLDTGTNTPPTSNDVYMLVGLLGNVATWVSFGGGDLETLTGNSGGPVGPDGALNINVVGDTTTINVAGNPGTNTLTISTVGTGVVNTLTGNSGGAVSPLAGNINVVGTGVISVVGNPGTHTLTVTPSGSIASSFPTDSGTAVPAAGALTVHGAHGLNTSGAGSTVTVAINNAITLGDLAILTSTSDALTVQSGNVTLQATGLNACGSIQLPQTNTAGTAGCINWNNGGSSYVTVMSFPNNNLCLGGNAFAPSITGGSVANILIGGGYSTITTGRDNTVVGAGIMTSLSTGSTNAILCSAHSLTSLTTGSGNAALGQCGAAITSGSSNLFLGISGGNYTGAESGNILIQSPGRTGESNTAYIANVRGVTTTANDAIAVLIDSSGQLGTVSSSRTKKDNIVDMGSYSDVIRSLRPVVFNYKEHSPESKSVGLIAEEVETIAPHLVAYNKDGEVESVKYHDLVPMLLNEFQKHCELIAALQAMNCNLLDRIRMLEEKNISCH